MGNQTKKVAMVPMKSGERWTKNHDQYAYAKLLSDGVVPFVRDIEKIPWTPPKLGPEWRVILQEENGVVVGRSDKMKVIATCGRELDERVWLHVSLSFPSRMPSYADMKEIKNLFIGPDKIAYELFPPEQELINAHPYCRHLWCPMEGSITPDFTRGNKTL